MPSPISRITFGGAGALTLCAIPLPCQTSASNSATTVRVLIMNPLRPSVPRRKERIAVGVLEHLRREIVGIFDADVDDGRAVAHRHEARPDEPGVGRNIERRVARLHLSAQLGIHLDAI